MYIEWQVFKFRIQLFLLPVSGRSLPPADLGSPGQSSGGSYLQEAMLDNLLGNARAFGAIYNPLTRGRIEGWTRPAIWRWQENKKDRMVLGGRRKQEIA